MAKKNSTKSVKPRPAGRVNSKSSVSTPERPPESQNGPASATKLAVVPPRQVGVLSDVEIGYVAGDVWGLLARTGPLTLAAIKKEVKSPGDLVVAAVGWLAREDKLDFTTAGRTVKISLR
jgi:Winged helix-turn-helix domain (DUF2582)